MLQAILPVIKKRSLQAVFNMPEEKEIRWREIR
jgi:hypothetical protein